MSELNLQHIKKVYPNGYEAVQDFNLDIKDGEFVIFVGPSGCGKSTTLRMVAGLEEITAGDLIIDGKRVNDLDPKDRDIAMVFQSYALYPHMTVRENMEFPLKIAKLPKDEINARVAEAAKTLGLESLLDRKPKALSGGQRQRVAMGRAIVRHPKVLLMDEPLSNLDAKLRGQMRVEISRLHEKLGSTIIYVTHDQTEAMTLGDRIVVMSNGEVQQIDTPNNLYKFPVNKFVAGFIGSPQMNFMDAVITEKGDKVYLTIGDDNILLPTAKAARLKEKGYTNGQVVTLGIRPENLSDQPDDLAKAKDCIATGKVEVYEMLGSTCNLYVNCNGVQITAAVDPTTTAHVGDMIQLAFNVDTLQIFDKETDNNILVDVDPVTGQLVFNA
ncbi:MAG: sn-glycerol-3-phosphate ABC transporter ATP-binding protein UgpC [Erysipelotrichaceae bacterium]|nr:sn-glycerol-3-phosphate ABC transporter ATP-binding protein UgpC [Erysipelotrichaceae bacterium]